MPVLRLLLSFSMCGDKGVRIAYDMLMISETLMLCMHVMLLGWEAGMLWVPCLLLCWHKVCWAVASLRVLLNVLGKHSPFFSPSVSAVSYPSFVGLEPERGSGLIGSCYVLHGTRDTWDNGIAHHELGSTNTMGSLLRFLAGLVINQEAALVAVVAVVSGLRKQPFTGQTLYRTLVRKIACETNPFFSPSVDLGFLSSSPMCVCGVPFSLCFRQTAAATDMLCRLRCKYVIILDYGSSQAT